MVAWIATVVGCRPEAPRAPDPPVVLNEVLARNDGVWTDPDSDECPEFDDVVEIYVTGDAPVALDEFTLEDAGGEPFALPAITLRPGERALFVADDSTDAFHLPFGVSQFGDTVVLRRAGVVVDAVDVPEALPDLSWARWGDGGPWRMSTPTPGEANEAPPDDPCFAPAWGFDDHTFPCLATREGFEAAAVARAGTSVVKFEILGFPSTNDLEVRFLDSRFYRLHDEWYIFRKLNGQQVRGEHLFASYPGSFQDIASIYRWAQARDLSGLFPSDFLRMTSSGRLTSQRFYELALGEPRVIGAGTLVHVVADVHGDERFLFELEFTDAIEHPELDAYFRTLEGSLGDDLSANLGWLVRSTPQEELAARMERDGLAWSDRITRFEDLFEPGRVEVYRGGTVAGPVRVVRAGDDPSVALPGDLLVLEEVPDVLPPCAGLITTTPQTPLSHVALLAESRKIPNLSVVGLTNDPRWDSWSRVRRPLAVRATVPDGFEVVELTDEEWATWLTLQEVVVGELEAVDTQGTPWLAELSTLDLDDTAEVRRTFGGKSAGYLALLNTPGVVVPDPVFGVSIRAYEAHVEPIADTIDAVLADPAFASPGDALARALLLEGVDVFDDRHPGDAGVRDAWLADHRAGTVLGDLARGDGLVGVVRDRDLPDVVVREVIEPLAAATDSLAPTQGLRFRSSSNVEDVEGFVGAGLYTSNTGYADDREGDSLEDALRATFASYWGAEAFEERQAAGLDHQNGAMGATVHPNFPDEAERANGVLHLTRLPGGGSELVINAQLGALSVTNPPVDTCELALPEVIRVRDDGAGPVVERLQASTEVAQVLDDADVAELWAQTVPVLDTWIAVDNAATNGARDRSVQTLDLEFRAVFAGWPAYDDGRVEPARMVVKQCRSLEPSPAGLPDELAALPVPKDVLGRTKAITSWACELAEGSVVATTFTTDPASTPDLGYGVVPFVGVLEVDGAELDWRDLTVTGDAADDLQIAFSPAAAAATGLAGVAWTPRSDCVASTPWASPVTWLDDLLDAAE